MSQAMVLPSGLNLIPFLLRNEHSTAFKAVECLRNIFSSSLHLEIRKSPVLHHDALQVA